MRYYLISFFLCVFVIFCLTELILSISRGEKGFTGTPRLSLSWFDKEYISMWLIIGFLSVLFIVIYLISA